MQGRRKYGSDECFIQLEEGIFKGTPRCRSYGSEFSEAREKLCAEGVDMRTKGEGSVKSNTEKLGVELNVTGGAGQSELGLMRSLITVRTEEATFTFRKVD